MTRIVRKSLALLLACLLSATIPLCAPALADGEGYGTDAVHDLSGYTRQGKPDQLVVLMPSVRLRTKASTSGGTVETLKCGAKLGYISNSEDGDWCRVMSENGNEGYIQTCYIGSALYTIRFLERTKGYRWPGASPDEFGSCAFDMQEEDALVLWKEGRWLFVVTESGRTGYVSEHAKIEIADEDDAVGAEEEAGG